MKRVLIIAYYFPPDIATGGIRIKGLTKYLPEFGWEPIILTKNVQDDSSLQCKIVKTPYSSHNSIFELFSLISTLQQKLKLDMNNSSDENVGKFINTNKKPLLRRVFKLIEEIIAYPDPQKKWYKYAFEKGEAILNNEEIDAIISTSSPVTSHIIAHNLKMKYNTPWIADLRDLWSQNHFNGYSFLRVYFDRRLEVKTLSIADVIVAVSEPLCNKLEQIHKGKTISCITNGFDSDEMSSRTLLSKKFCLVYTGTIYDKKQDPNLFLQAIHELVVEQKISPDELKIEFYGPNSFSLKKIINDYCLQNIISLNDFVSREMASKIQKEAQILLFFNWNDPYVNGGIYTAKIFDYLAAQRPILSMGTIGGVVEKLLAETNTGINVKSVNEIKDVIMKYYDEFKLNGIVNYHGIHSEIMKYDHRNMAKNFADKLDIISSSL